jgi:uncharacterized protein with HEPN domain
VQAFNTNLNRDLAEVQRLADAHGVRVLRFDETSPETKPGAGVEILLEVETPAGRSRLGAAEFMLALEETFNQPVRVIHCAGSMREPVEGLCLHGILGGIARARALPVPSVMALLPDRGLREKVVQELRLIGELAHHVPRSFQDGHPDVAWESVERYRNFLLVDNLDMRELWEILHVELPRLASQVWALIDQPEEARLPPDGDHAAGTGAAWE